MKRDILSILDLSGDELERIIEDAMRLKQQKKENIPHPWLKGKTLGLLFEKASTRTRISFEVGMFELGGHALFLNRQDLQLGRGEEIRDTARVFSRYLSAVMIRAFRHSTVEDLAKNASIPVINGLSDREHPCQILADILTLREQFGSVEDLTIAWLGDGNNVCNSLALSSALTGYSVRIATPPAYEPPADIITAARNAGARVSLSHLPEEAASGADVIYTDTWISMGNEEERAVRLRAFQNFTVDENILRRAAPGARIMHCLPAHRGEEITDAVMEGSQSIIWDQAENRLHAQKALLVFLLGKQEMSEK